MDVLTVEEMLMYTAELKRPLREGKSSKKAAVDGLIDDLGLEACKNVRIGNSMNRGISGGQVRNVLIGLLPGLCTDSIISTLGSPASVFNCQKHSGIKQAVDKPFIVQNGDLRRCFIRVVWHGKSTS